MRSKKWWIVSLCIVVLATGSWFGYGYLNKEDNQLVASYITSQVRKGTIEVKISGTGSIQPSARKTLKARTAGKAAKVYYIEGDTVKKGDILVTYEEESTSNQINSKRIDMKKKKLELTNLQSKYKQAEDDEARQELALSIQKQELDIEISAEEIEDLEYTESIDPIIAPIDGVLATFDIQAGDSISPNAELGEIVNYTQLQIIVGIDELDITKVKLDQEAEIVVEAIPDETFTGKVVAIAEEGTSSNGVASFEVSINLLEATNLKVGMSAEASIRTEMKTNALYVPIEAVQSAQGRYFVMVPSAMEQGAQAGQAEQPVREGQGERPAQVGQTDPLEQEGQSGQTGQVRPGRQGGSLPEGLQNSTDEERAAMREQFMAGRGSGGAGAQGGAATTNSTSTTRVAVEVGISNEDNIEIISGLAEGDVVILPTLVSSTNSNTQMAVPGIGAGFTGGGFPGSGGAGGGFTGGGAVGGRPSIGAGGGVGR